MLPATIPPKIEDVIIYFNQREMPATEAECFFLFYEKKGWKGKSGNYIKNWRNIAYQWILGIIKHEPWRFNKELH